MCKFHKTIPQEVSYTADDKMPCSMAFGGLNTKLQSEFSKATDFPYLVKEVLKIQIINQLRKTSNNL